MVMSSFTTVRLYCSLKMRDKPGNRVYWGFERRDMPRYMWKGDQTWGLKTSEGGAKPNSKASKFYFSIHIRNVVTNLSYVYPNNRFFWSISQGLVRSFISKYLCTNIIIRCMFTNRSNNKFASSIGQKVKV